MRFKIFLIILLAFSTALSFGQSRKKNKKRSKRTEQSSQQQQPTALNPLPQKEYAPKARKATKGATYESEQQYYERMEALAKTRRKNETLQQKPQYSDPMYFGHKRPPKKRKPGKMKYCKECGLRH
jgi:hypothetical protein